MFPERRRLASGILFTRVIGTLLDPFVIMRHRYMMLQIVATMVRVQLGSDTY
jgi:hypothetical protein